MKRILLFVLLGVSTCFILTGCNKEQSTVKNNAELNEINGVSMTIKDGTLTRTGATIVITDISGIDNIYGSEYRIDRKDDSKWKELELIYKGNYGWDLIGYKIDKDNKLEMNLNWEELYGKLENGEYRIVKSITGSDNNEKQYFSVEFIIK